MKTRIGIMQPYFFPYIGYWQLMNLVDKYVIYDDVQYIKGGWINRNQILLNGNKHFINLQMQGASANKMINEISVSNDFVYRRKLLKTIENAYQKAPFYSTIYPIIEESINSKENNLAKYLTNIIKGIAEYLEMNTEFFLSSQLNENFALHGADKVINICQVLEGTCYVNAIGGRKLYRTEVFQKQGIELYFLETKNIEYKQFGNSFISNLSIIDVLMFNPVQKVKDMLNDYRLYE